MLTLIHASCWTRDIITAHFRQRHWNKILDYRPRQVTCSDHVMRRRPVNNYAMLSCLGAAWRRDLKLLGSEASLTRSFDCECAHAHRRSASHRFRLRHLCGETLNG